MNEINCVVNYTSKVQKLCRYIHLSLLPFTVQVDYTDRMYDIISMDSEIEC